MQVVAWCVKHHRTFKTDCLSTVCCISLSATIRIQRLLQHFGGTLRAQKVCKTIKGALSNR